MSNAPVPVSQADGATRIVGAHLPPCIPLYPITSTYNHHPSTVREVQAQGIPRAWLCIPHIYKNHRQLWPPCGNPDVASLCLSAAGRSRTSCSSHASLTLSLYQPGPWEEKLHFGGCPSCPSSGGSPQVFSRFSNTSSSFLSRLYSWEGCRGGFW